MKKRFTVVFLTKAMKKSDGKVSQYYVTDRHEGIVLPEVFELTQYEYQRRRERGGYQIYSDSSFSGHIACGDCGTVSHEHQRLGGIFERT